jgi:hypothetical protein
MWIIQGLLFSVVAGSIFGLGWHMFNEWRERANKEENKEE